MLTRQATLIADAPPADRGAAFGGLLVYPELFVGGAFNSNPTQTAGFHRSASGLRIRPAIDVVRDAGIQRTRVSAQADLQVYDTGQGATAAQSLNRNDGRLAITHLYEARRDLLFRFDAAGTHTRDVFGIGVVPAYPSAYPQTIDQIETEASVKKTFNRLFVVLGGTLARTRYSDVPSFVPTAIARTPRSDDQKGVVARIGYHIGADLYGFVEPSLNWHRYDAARYDSHGTRVIGGFGAARLRLLSGELYAGYEHQTYSGSIGETARPVFGGRVSWFPTRRVTMTARLDQTFGLAYALPGAPAAPALAPLQATHVTTLRFDASYKVDTGWFVGAKTGYAQTAYRNRADADTRWMLGASVAYNIRRNWALTAEYEFSRLHARDATSPAANQSLASVGVRYQY